jgi:hypothetical protein
MQDAASAHAVFACLRHGNAETGSSSNCAVTQQYIATSLLLHHCSAAACTLARTIDPHATKAEQQ